jgi:hypothetical protein
MRSGLGRGAWAIIAAALGLAARGLSAQAPGVDTVMAMGDSTEVAEQAHAAMSGAMLEDLHMRMTAPRTGTPADSARGRALVTAMRQALDRYRDVRVAEADGFHQFLPRVRQAVYHFTNRRNALGARFHFDPARPTSLLYRQDSSGAFTLVGAMYTAPPSATEAELDARVPLGLARWHEHVNWCLPPIGARERWREQRDGHPVFGPKSPIATRAACDAVGGRFLPRIFGWMVHVNAFAGDDPAVIWAGHPEEGHGP